MASYVAAYRIGMLVSTAGVLFLVTGFEDFGFAQERGLDLGLSRHGGAGGGRHRHHARRDRADRNLRPDRQSAALETQIGAFAAR